MSFQQGPFSGAKHSSNSGLCDFHGRVNNNHLYQQTDNDLTLAVFLAHLLGVMTPQSL